MPDGEELESLLTTLLSSSSSSPPLLSERDTRERARCCLGERAVISTAEIDSLECSVFLTLEFSRDRISPPNKLAAGELGMVLVT